MGTTVRRSERYSHVISAPRVDGRGSATPCRNPFRARASYCRHVIREGTVYAASAVTDWITAVATALGVVATFAAVVVALVLAGREERRRVKDKEARALAQARLVRVTTPNWGIGALE